MHCFSVLCVTIVYQGPLYCLWYTMESLCWYLHWLPVLCFIIVYQGPQYWMWETMEYVCRVRVREIDTNLPRNLDNRRTFFQGSQVSMKQPKWVSQSKSIGLGPFALSFHSITLSLIPWEQLSWRCFWAVLWARSWVCGKELNLGVRDF